LRGNAPPALCGDWRRGFSFQPGSGSVLWQQRRWPVSTCGEGHRVRSCKQVPDSLLRDGCGRKQDRPRSPITKCTGAEPGRATVCADATAWTCARTRRQALVLVSLSPVAPRLLARADRWSWSSLLVTSRGASCVPSNSV
jgi:hypothetical protein